KYCSFQSSCGTKEGFTSEKCFVAMRRNSSRSEAAMGNMLMVIGHCTPKGLHRFDNTHCPHAIHQRTAQVRHALTRRPQLDQTFYGSLELCRVKVASLTHVHHHPAMRQNLHHARLHSISRIA